MFHPPEKALTLQGPNGRLAAMLHDAGGDRLVILAHGYTGTKVENGRLFVSTARALAREGISALRFDFWGSGDSAGEFYDMTPNTEIADLEFVIRWAARRRLRTGVLGLSMGGGVAICACARQPGTRTIVTWSTVPSFRAWRQKGPVIRGNPLSPGPGFWTDRPVTDIPDADASLRIPKLQIQGDGDLEGFVEGFQAFLPNAHPPKRHVVIRGADHVFTRWEHRRRVIGLTVRWFARWL